jgi:hypothetical protein
MLSYEFYKSVHLFGLFLLIGALGALIMNRINGGSWENPSRKFLAISHGIGTLLVLITGFGMTARGGIAWPWPCWLWGMLAIWLFFGAEIALIRRKPQWSKALWWTTLILAGVAAYLGVFKPGA